MLIGLFFKFRFSSVLDSVSWFLLKNELDADWSSKSSFLSQTHRARRWWGKEMGRAPLPRKTALKFVFKPPNVCIPFQKPWSVPIQNIIWEFSDGQTYHQPMNRVDFKTHQIFSLHDFSTKQFTVNLMFKLTSVRLTKTVQWSCQSSEKGYFTCKKLCSILW